MFWRILHMILASLLLISSVGVVLGKHYCKDELKNVALFAEASPCHAAKKQCPRHASMMIETDAPAHPKGCCDSEVEFLKDDTNQQTVDDDFQLSAPVLALGHGLFIAASWPLRITSNQSYTRYKPPPLVCDLLVRLQTFLC